MQATKTRRTLEVMSRIDREYIPAVLVREGKKSDAYCVVAIPGAVKWHHRGDSERRYTVTCVAGKPVRCDCPSRVPCRHLIATRKLLMIGELAVPTDDRDELDGYLVSVE